MILISQGNKEGRWKLFEHYATRFFTGKQEFGLTRKEYGEFIYLKYFFAEDYALKRTRPWLIGTVFDKVITK